MADTVNQASPPYYSVTKIATSEGMNSLRAVFPEGQADDLTFVLFSASGVHGHYGSIEDAEAFLRLPGEDTADDVTFLIVNPRTVTLRYGNCQPKTQDDIDFLKALRESSHLVLQSMTAGPAPHAAAPAPKVGQREGGSDNTLEWLGKTDAGIRLACMLRDEVKVADFQSTLADVIRLASAQQAGGQWDPPAIPEGTREAAMVVIERDQHGKPTVWCDPEIVDLVGALNTRSLRTVASCSGHGGPFGNIVLADGRELLILPDFDSTRFAERVLGAAFAAGESPAAEVYDAADDVHGSAPMSAVWAAQGRPEVRLLRKVPIGSKLYGMPPVDVVGYAAFGVDGTKAVALHAYFGPTEADVLGKVLARARKEGFSGTAEDRMRELGWEVRPVYGSTVPLLRKPRGVEVGG